MEWRRFLRLKSSGFCVTVPSADACRRVKGGIMRVIQVMAIAVPAVLAGFPAMAQSMIPPPPPPGIAVPDWALPQSPTHKQVPPPAGFHRASVTYDKPIGIFENQTGVGGPLVPGSASFDAGTYTITAAGYNIWYQRDEFHFLWKKMTGDVSLAASVTWPHMDDFHDRKVALVFRDSLDDDSREIVAAQHGNGMVHIAWRPETGAQMTDIEYRSQRQPVAGETGPQTFHPARLGIEKKGDRFQLYVSWQGEALHPEGRPVTFHSDGPFYVGIGFTSHLPATALTAKVSDVWLKNEAGLIH
jgi:hypothetical protein